MRNESILAAAARTLRRAGVPSPRNDAELLLAHVRGVSRTELVGLEEACDDAQAQVFEVLVTRRSAGTPLQHLTGASSFRYVDIEVGPGVFIPRPETELVAGAAIDELRAILAAGEPTPRAIDLCTGSGAVALAMSTEVPQAEVVAVELLEPAYAYAARNLRGTGVDLRLGDIRTACADLVGSQHVVVANPPYIPLAAYETVPPEVRDFEPPEALWSGDDGLDVIRAVEDVASKMLVSGGLVVCEHADVQGTTATAVFTAPNRWTDVRDHLDLNRRPRFITARRRAR